MTPLRPASSLVGPVVRRQGIAGLQATLGGAGAVDENLVSAARSALRQAKYALDRVNVDTGSTAPYLVDVAAALEEATGHLRPLINDVGRRQYQNAVDLNAQHVDLAARFAEQTEAFAGRFGTLTDADKLARREDLLVLNPHLLEIWADDQLSRLARGAPVAVGGQRVSSLGELEVLAGARRTEIAAQARAARLAHQRAVENAGGEAGYAAVGEAMRELSVRGFSVPLLRDSALNAWADAKPVRVAVNAEFTVNAPPTDWDHFLAWETHDVTSLTLRSLDDLSVLRTLARPGRAGSGEVLNSGAEPEARALLAQALRAGWAPQKLTDDDALAQLRDGRALAFSFAASLTKPGGSHQPDEWSFTSTAPLTVSSMTDLRHLVSFAAR